MDYLVVPVEALPIPYSMTDVGRAFLAQLRAMELAEVEVSVARLDTELRRPQPRPRRK